MTLSNNFYSRGNDNSDWTQLERPSGFPEADAISAVETSSYCATGPMGLVSEKRMGMSSRSGFSRWRNLTHERRESLVEVPVAQHPKIVPSSCDQRNETGHFEAICRSTVHVLRLSLVLAARPRLCESHILAISPAKFTQPLARRYYVLCPFHEANTPVPRP